MKRANPSNGDRPHPKISARQAGLVHVNDERTAGITRQRRGKSFVYRSPRGRIVRDFETLARIRSLVIPPAWEDVWICPLPNGHLQATGRDARGRKQHRYHPRWRQARDQNKYERMVAFGRALPTIRKKTDAHLRRHGLPREKVLAAVVQLLEKTFIRVGNEEYANDNGSFGLTTLRDKHVRVNGGTARFQFRGKHGIEHAVDLNDKRLAKIVKNCQDLPGYEVFQYFDERGRRRDVKSEDVNEYLREITGQDFTAKDFRTWAGTVLAARALQEVKRFDSRAQAKKNVVAAVEAVAKRLGNTKAVCRKCYIHPAVIDSYMDGSLLRTLSRRAGEELKRRITKLSPEETAILALLQRRLAREAKSQM